MSFQGPKTGVFRRRKTPKSAKDSISKVIQSGKPEYMAKKVELNIVLNWKEEHGDEQLLFIYV